MALPTHRVCAQVNPNGPLHTSTPRYLFKGLIYPRERERDRDRDKDGYRDRDRDMYMCMSMCAYIKNMYIYIHFMHTYVHTYIHTFIHTYMHAYVFQFCMYGVWDPQR